MARGDSEIRVRIIGDAKSLTGALATADRSLGATVKGLGVGIVALGGVAAGFAFLKSATAEADRLADATSRLEIQLGDLAEPLKASASSFRDLGLSSQDMLELEANFADLATTVGLSNTAISQFADDAAATAQAISLLEDVDATTVIEQIGRAANGSEKAMLALGVSVDETEVVARALATTGKATAGALTDGELAAARLSIILDQLNPKLVEATTGTADLELSQRRLDAAAEELQAKLGGPLSDALAVVLGFINDEIDAIPHAIEGWQMLGHQIDVFGREALTPLAQVAQALENILRLLNLVNDAPRSGHFGGGERDIVRNLNNHNERNGLNTGMGVP